MKNTQMANCISIIINYSFRAPVFSRE